MVWRLEDPQGNEAAKVRWEIVPYTRGQGLDLGCGPSKAFPHFIGVDSCKDTELFGVPIKPDIQIDTCERLTMFGDESMDFVFSSHLLEHIEDHVAALREWWRVIKIGGYLVLYLPHKQLYPNIGQPGANPDHKHDFMPDEIRTAMASLCPQRGQVTPTSRGHEVIMDEVRAQGMEYSFLQVYRKRGDSHVGDCLPDRKTTKRCCVVRYGGFGDQIQASNILPALKRQGYRVTFMTTPKGKEILEHDPHIDEFLLQDTDQVPNHELSEYWKVWERRFDKWVNLSESVEGTLLALPGRANHGWPDVMRRKYLGVNYGEFTADIAQVPYASEAKFYPSGDEEQRAKAYIARCDSIATKANPPSVPLMQVRALTFMWILAGSSVHKFYPWMDHVTAKILIEIPEAVVIMIGDEACKILEQGWEEEPRVLRESGNLSIRDTLALAQRVDCIIGPETGVLNAVAFDQKVAKILLLSHSSKENISKHWVNTHSIKPSTVMVPCYPCHRLHYGTEFCPTDQETGAAMCQKSITPDRVWSAIEDFARSKVRIAA